jgi:hypothetical protein
MEQIDRLGWAAGLSVRAYGRSIGIRVSDPSLLDQVRAALPSGWKPSESTRVERLYSLLHGGDTATHGVRRFHLLYGDWTRLGRTLHLDELFPILAADLRLFVAEWARTRVFLHAGAVGWRGRAILLPGPSQSGKSTLVAELVRAGARYYSDEFAVIDRHGRIHPFHKPISLRDDGPAQIDHAVESLGGRNGQMPLPVGLIVAAPYKEGMVWEPRTLSAGEGALTVLANAVAARSAPERVLQAVEQITARAPVLEGPRGDAGDTARRLLDLAASLQKPLDDASRGS